MNALLRTTFIISTIAAICFALVQLGCRLLFWQLPLLEDTLNGALAEQGVVVRGLQGRWNGINPGLFADQVTFPAGLAIGLDFELDVLESLGRNRLVARRLTVADGRLAFDRTPQGWRLRGTSGDASFDVLALLTHSDQVWLRGRIDLHEAARRAEIHVESMLINQDGNHRFHVGLQTSASCDGCALTVEGDLTEDGPGALRVAGESIVLADDLVELAGLAALFPNADAGRIAIDLAGDWRRAADGKEHARLQVAADVEGLPLAAARIGLAATAWRDRDQGYRGRIDSMSLASGDAAFDLGGGGFTIRPGALAGALWLPAFSIDDVGQPLVRAYGPDHGIGRHLAQLEPQAQVSGLGVHFDDRGIAFHGYASEVASHGYKGIPAVANGAFSFGGDQHATRLHFEGSDVLLAFPEYLTAHAEHDAVSGLVTLVYGHGRIGLRGTNITVREGRTRAAGSFALSRQIGANHSQVIVDGQVDQVDVDTARDYVPLTLSAELRTWLRESISAGQLADSRMVYQGRTTIEDDLPWRRFEITSRFTGATVAYHPDWPTARRVSGRFTLTPAGTRVRGQAEAFGVDLPAFELNVLHDPDDGRQITAAALSLACDTTVSRLLDFARATPIHRALPFLSDAWSGDGPVHVATEARIPLGDRAMQPGDVTADFRFDNASLDLANVGLPLDAIEESVRFVFPADLSSTGLRATLFGAPVTIGIVSDHDRIRFDVTGSATPPDAYRLLNVEDPGVADGRFRYDARFTVFPASDRATELEVTSDLEGVAVRLPPPLAKARDEIRSLAAAMQFLDTHVAVAARYGNTDGWLHTADGGIRAGAIGIGGSAPMVDAADGRVVLGGSVVEIDSQTMAALIAPSDRERPFAWELRRFSIGKTMLDDFEITDAEVNGFADGNEVRLAIDAAELSGTVAKSGDAPWQLELDELRLPAAQGDGDPVSVASMDRLLAADVQLHRVFVGDEDYGSWQLSVRPHADGVTLADIVAVVRGLSIESDGEVVWSRAGETRFAGAVRATNLLDVLPLWGFAPSVESEAFHATGQVRWPGSPLNFDLARLSGDAALSVTNGRFLDVAQGATPILSLVNFSTIAKRMNLDFSDVFGAGVSFEEVKAEMTVDDGLARFTKAAEIVGTGSSFRVAGTVDLDSGALDNEMVVTLPLHSSLPWYAAFLALSNPAGAAAVVVGRQVFKDQIRRLTSGKYRIRGTYEEPEVEFVGIFVDDVDVAPATEVPASPSDRADRTSEVDGLASIPEQAEAADPRGPATAARR